MVYALPSMSNHPGPPMKRSLSFSGAQSLALAADHQLAGDIASERPAVLLAHGFGQTRQSWSTTQQKLALRGHASLAWDMRGHGRSGRNPETQPYRAEDFVEDVVAAAKQLSLQDHAGKPVLVGASMGGLTGLMAQAQYQPFSALVLVDVTPRWEAAGVQRIQAFMAAHPDGFDSYEHAAASIAAYLPHRRERKTPAQLAHLLHAQADGRLRWHWDPRMLAEFVQHSGQLQDTIAEATRGIEVPVLLVSGGRSDLVSERTIADFLALVPHASHVQLPEATHMVAGDDNDAFTDTLLDFLGAQSNQSQTGARR